MKYVQFYYNDSPTEIFPGYVVGDGIVDINKYDSTIPPSMLKILETGCVCKINRSIPNSVPTESESTVTLVAPITGVDKVICTRFNYVDVCLEFNREFPSEPMFYSKFASCIIGPSEPIRIRTAVSKKVDWQVELAVVMKRKCTDVSVENALDYVFGYTIGQDITARDWEEKKNGGQLLLGPAQDTFCPIGPWISTPDEVGDPHHLDIKCTVNNREKQNSNTTQLIHPIPYLISRLSSIMTLMPGDIIFTGSPAGSGSAHNPTEYLVPGDVICSEIENIGSLNLTVQKYCP